jgi:hypothetical protein
MAGLQLTAVDAGPFRLERSKLGPFAQGMVSIPTTVGIIQHPKRGLVLWDTGVNHGAVTWMLRSSHSAQARSLKRSWRWKGPWVQLHSHAPEDARQHFVPLENPSLQSA